MACSVKRHYPFDDGESLSSSLKKLHCSSSPTRTGSPQSSPVSDIGSSSQVRPSSVSHSSPFPELPNVDLSQKILQELRKLQHKMAASSRKIDGSSQSDDQHKDAQQTFTVNQVRIICSRLLRERENEVRAEYDQVLNDRLSEQYETFVKFAQDQIQSHQTRAGEPSYFS